MLNTQRGISYLPSGKNSKEAYLRRQAQAAKLAEQVATETERAYNEYSPAQVFHQDEMLGSDLAIATHELGIDLSRRVAA